MDKLCWNCNAVLTIEEGRLIKDCSCGAVNDFTPYEPLKEDDVIPEIKNKTTNFLPWLIGKDSPIQPEKGLEITVTGEWEAPNNPKITYFVFGECECGGEKFTNGINSTSYFNISKVYGKDTKDWVGKKLVYQGKVKMGSRGAIGHLWIAKE